LPQIALSLAAASGCSDDPKYLAPLSREKIFLVVRKIF
jgi:hypothetical protein